MSNDETTTEQPRAQALAMRAGGRKKKGASWRPCFIRSGSAREPGSALPQFIDSMLPDGMDSGAGAAAAAAFFRPAPFLRPAPFFLPAFFAAFFAAFFGPALRAASHSTIRRISAMISACLV